MLKATGLCNGIENYSRFLDGRARGEPPFTLLNYFPDDWLVFLDESHVSLPQVGGMYKGDRSRKETLVEYGFRLPSALDNRPLRYEEWSAARQAGGLRLGDALGAGAGALERRRGRADRAPDRPARSRRSRCARRARRSTTCLHEIRRTVKAGWRVLVTTLTKRSAEELTNYFLELGVQGALAALGDRRDRAHGDPARPAPGRLRRAGRDQPPARGPRPARGGAGRDPRRRQGGLPALERPRWCRPAAARRATSKGA